jgi:hypothetical protein
VLRALIADDDGRWLERRSGEDPEALARELTELAEAHSEAGTPCA